MSTSRFIDKSVQTVIRVQTKKDDEDSVKVLSEKKMQTMIATQPNEDDSNFISLLRYTPYQDIYEDALKIIDLPRKARLQFGSLAGKFYNDSGMFSLLDDDGVGYVCCEVVRFHDEPRRIEYADSAVQTDLKIRPHILSEESVATVTRDTGAQASGAGCSKMRRMTL